MYLGGAMASTSQIHALRIDISDPPDIINIESVATSGDLPEIPEPQTAYYIIDTAKYVQTEKTSEAVLSDYLPVELFLSDSKLNGLINTFGFDVAIYKAIKLISSKLGSKLLMVRNQNGAESVEYVRLKELYDYYKALVADFKEETSASSGRYVSTTNPTIAGGNL